MNRTILTYGGYFETFMESLQTKEKEKVQYGLLLLKTQNRLSTKFVKHIKDGVYELRTEYAGNIYRIFFIFDDGKYCGAVQRFSEKNTENTTNRN